MASQSSTEAPAKRRRVETVQENGQEGEDAPYDPEHPAMASSDERNPTEGGLSVISSDKRYVSLF